MTEENSAVAINWAARLLLRATRQASLATVGDGQPFASLVTPAVGPDGAVLMLLSGLSEHTRHLRAEPRCALLFAGASTDENPQTASRITISGVAQLSGDPSLKAYWLARHPYAALYAGLPDFALWRIMPESGFYVGGFAMARRLPGEALRSPPDHVAAIAAAEAAIIAHCNADHAGSLAELAARHGRTGPWLMLGVDCDGFDLLQDHAVLRLGFPQPVHDAAGVRSALIALLSESRGGGLRGAGQADNHLGRPAMGAERTESA